MHIYCIVYIVTVNSIGTLCRLIANLTRKYLMHFWLSHVIGRVKSDTSLPGTDQYRSRYY